jgi:hypothetical protein
MVMSLSWYPDISALLFRDVPREIGGHGLRKAGRSWNGTAPPKNRPAGGETRHPGPESSPGAGAPEGGICRTCKGGTGAQRGKGRQRAGGGLMTRDTGNRRKALRRTRIPPGRGGNENS